MSIVLLVFFLLVLKSMKLLPINVFNEEYISYEETRCIEGVFVFLVIMAHYKTYISTGNYDVAYLKFHGHLGQCVVAPFLFYSGYGMMNSIAKKGSQYVRYLPKKFLKLLIQFDFAVFLFVITNYLLYERIYPKEVLLKSLIGWNSIGNSNWYIFCMLCMYVCMYVGFVFNSKNDNTFIRPLILTSLFAVGYIFTMKWLGREPWWYNTVFCFIAGLWFYQIKPIIEKILQHNDVKYYLAMSVLGILYVLLFLWHGQKLIYYELWSMLFSFFLVIITMKIELSSSLLTFLGNHVFSIYILQRIPMMVLKNNGFLGEHPYGGLIIVICSTIILAVFFDKIINQLYTKIGL